MEIISKTYLSLLSQALRKLTGAIKKSNCVAIFINQLREKVGIMFGNPETTPGGRALKFYASVRMDVRKAGTNKQGDDIISNTTKVKIVKNKVAPPFKIVEFDIVFGKGIDKMGDLIEEAIKEDIVEKRGSWYSYGDIKLGQGKPNASKYLEENEEIANEIWAKVMGTYNVEDDLSETKEDVGA